MNNPYTNTQGFPQMTGHGQANTFSHSNLPGTQSMQRTHDVKPDKFDGKTIEWNDYIVHFEQVALLNNWSDSQKASMLCINLRGEAQRLL